MDGLGVNEGRIIDPIMFKSDYVTDDISSSYRNGIAIKCVTPNVEVFDTGYYPANTLGGIFDIDLYWLMNGSPDPFTPAGVLEVWKDDELVAWSGDAVDGNIYLTYVGTNTVGTSLILYFDPDSMYRFVLRSSEYVSNSYPLIFDYIKFTPHSSNIPFMSRVNPTFNELTGSEIFMFDYGSGTISGPGVAGTSSYTVCYPDYAFKRLSFAGAQIMATFINETVDVINTTPPYVKVFGRHNNESSVWSSGTSYVVYWWCVGVVEAPVIRPLVVP